MAKQLLASLAHPVKVRVPRPVLAIGGVLCLGLVIAGIWTVATPRPATCQGVCQCWYCPQYRTEVQRHGGEVYRKAQK